MDVLQTSVQLYALKTVMLKLNQGYMNDFSAASVLTLSNENLHSWIRLATETPTSLDCANDFCIATHELIKKQCELKLHYFTSKKRPHFQQDKHV